MTTLRRRLGSESEKEPSGFISTNFNVYGERTSNVSTDSLVPSVNLYETGMTCRDRTPEFHSAVKSLQGHQNGLISVRESKRSNNLQYYSEFMKIAKLIGKDISNTYTKLEKLTLLAKRKSLFDDKPVEIQELTYIIKQDISSLNSQIAKLQELCKARQNGTGKHIQTHSNSVVVSLQTKLASMSNDFKSVLEIRTENLKQQKNRRDQYSQGPLTSNLPASAMSGYHTGSVLLNDEHSDPGGSSNDVAINMNSTMSNYQQQLLIEEQDTYLQSRTETMQNIESTIVELGGIFQQLAHMVKEQEEMIQRIDHNIDDTSLNVEAAHNEILKYFRTVTSNRWLMIKIFAVLIFFFVIFVVFLA